MVATFRGLISGPHPIPLNSTVSGLGVRLEATNYKVAPYSSTLRILSVDPSVSDVQLLAAVYINIDESMHNHNELKYSMLPLSLTLGAHAQRGLQYLVCVSVCVCVCYTTSHFSQDYSCHKQY